MGMKTAHSANKSDATVSHEWLDLKKLDSVPCNLCGQDSAQIFSTESRFGIPLNSVICKNCTLMYINPRMSNEQYKTFYKSTYRKFMRVEVSTENIFDKEVKEGQGIIEFCKDWIRPQQKVLEVGCGPGGILHAMKSHGLESFGIEPSEEESDYARKKGLHVESIMLEDMKGQNQKFD